MKSLGSYDCCVVGGGPVGAVAARSAALWLKGHRGRHGARVLLVERGGAPTYPDRCTGIVSLRLLKEADLDQRVIVREIRGGIIHAPNGRCLRIEAADTRAVVIDRRLFNRRLLEMAQAAGVEFVLESLVIGLEDGAITIERGNETYKAEARVVIGADGPRSRVAAWAKLPPPGEFLLGLQAMVRYEPEEPDFIEVFVDQELAPGFFAWVVPAEEGIARVGLATHHMKGSSDFLKKFLEKLKLKPLKVNAGLIPIGPRAQTVAGKVLVVGDAAAQAKPFSGGGLYTGICAAKIAGEVAAEYALAHEDTKSLAAYEKRWRERLDGELSLGMSLRRLFRNLHNREINFVFEVLDNKALLDVVAAYGDIDYPSLIIKALLQRPKEWWRVFKGLNAKLTPAEPH
ncbi:MAG: NAD(P)/FAD-dependent oxidoreductase [Desulfobacterales bacterium]|nr:NAD(P)/FAD-dependent oxidoreductase [Desulfobacterales bacterium]